eukprot:144101-Hanusia_phi.AAC.6
MADRMIPRDRGVERSEHRATERFSSARQRAFKEEAVGSEGASSKSEVGTSSEWGSRAEWRVQQEPASKAPSIASNTQRRRRLYTKWRELLADDSSASDGSDHEIANAHLRGEGGDVQVQKDGDSIPADVHGLHLDVSAPDEQSIEGVAGLSPAFASKSLHAEQKCVSSTAAFADMERKQDHNGQCGQLFLCDGTEISTVEPQQVTLGHEALEQTDRKNASLDEGHADADASSVVVSDSELGKNPLDLKQSVSTWVSRDFSPDNLSFRQKVDPVLLTPNYADLSREQMSGELLRQSHAVDLNLSSFTFQVHASPENRKEEKEAHSTALYRAKGLERLIKEMQEYFDCKQEGLVGWFLDLDEDGDGLVTAGELLDEIHAMRYDVDKEAAAELVGILTDEDIKAISLSSLWKFFMLPRRQCHQRTYQPVGKSSWSELESKCFTPSLEAASEASTCNSYSSLMPCLSESQFDLEIFEMSRAASKEILSIRARTRELERMIRLQALSSAYELQPFMSSSLATPRKSVSPGHLSSRNSQEVFTYIRKTAITNRSSESTRVPERARKTFYSPERVRSESPASSGLAYLNFHFPSSSKRSSR